jgi:SAM-dependent methyltransferase
MRWIPWPVPAVVVWLACWASHLGVVAAGGPPWAGFVAGVAVSLAGTLLAATGMRRAVIVAGFPLSLALAGMAGPLPPWLWLVPVVALLALYPVRTWRDAPLFPTPRGALRGLGRLAPVSGTRGRGGARILDAGCGLGDGLRALRDEYPHCSIEGLEWSWPIWVACGIRCPWADVRRGDLWKESWADYDLVYLFQRPETMHRAVEKARRELRPGAYLVSLDFEAAELKPTAVLHTEHGRTAWVYRPSVEEHTHRLGRPHQTTLIGHDASGRGFAAHDDQVIDLDEIVVTR